MSGPFVVRGVGFQFLGIPGVHMSIWHGPRYPNRPQVTGQLRHRVAAVAHVAGLPSLHA